MIEKYLQGNLLEINNYNWLKKNYIDKCYASWNNIIVKHM